ncbi:hypothetical protein SLE2022_266320 [Rubroshorea leprosula]
MTIDDNNKVYIGGLPYDATEETLRRVFGIYGAVVAVKIINEHPPGGKCYGFVTFTNPRSAVDAISDMNGRAINGQVVKVNEVTTRGGRSHFSRDRHRQTGWDKGRERERNRDHGSYHYRDRFGEHDLSGDHDASRERVYEYHNRDRARGSFFDRDQDRDMEDNVQGEGRDHYRVAERDRELSLDRDGIIDGSDGYDRSNGEDKDQLKRWNGSIPNDQNSPGLSSDSTDNYDQVKKELDRSLQGREELKKEISQMEGRLVERQKLVLDLQKKAKTLEDALVTAKKLSSKRKMQLTKLHKCFLQVKDYRERLKSSELELESLVESTMLESGDDVDIKNSTLANGFA